MYRLSRLAVAVLLLVPPLFGQSTPGSGHWEGVIQLPDNEVAIEVDLAKTNEGWVGTLKSSQQKMKAPLEKIAAKENSVSFAIKGVPGNPAFQGTLSADGKSISGNFTQGERSFTFKLTRTGDAKIEAPAKSTPVSKEFEGRWEGTLDVGERQLKLALKLANQPDGTAAGSIISVDQGGAEIPITTITQKGSNLKLDIEMIGGSYTGDLNKEGTELSGQWSQGPGTFPLTFKRAPKEGAKEK